MFSYAIEITLEFMCKKEIENFYWSSRSRWRLVYRRSSRENVRVLSSWRKNDTELPTFLRLLSTVQYQASSNARPHLLKVVPLLDSEIQHPTRSYSSAVCRCNRHCPMGFSCFRSDMPLPCRPSHLKASTEALPFVPRSCKVRTV